MPAANSGAAKNSGSRVSTSSGTAPGWAVSAAPSVRAQARASPPTTTATSDRPSAIARSTWLTTVCWETPIWARWVRAPVAPTRAATSRAGSAYDHVPCGTAIRSAAASSVVDPASWAAASTARAISSAGSHGSAAVPTPTSTGVRGSTVAKRQTLAPAAAA